jgi:hypothetical protein
VNNSHTDRIRIGSLYPVVDLSYVPAKDDEWFPMEIMVQGDTITICIIVGGPSTLRGRTLDSRDIRSGLPLIAAALSAKGVSTVLEIDRPFVRRTSRRNEAPRDRLRRNR